MRVTLALLTWNHASSVAAAVAALRAQTHADLEILVQDDGSSDATLAVAAAAADGDPRVRIMTTPRNLGGWGNLALAAERATGDMICWACPGDDWDPHFVSALVGRLSACPGSVAAMCGTIDIDEHSRAECGRRSLAGRGTPEKMGWFELACSVLLKTRPDDLVRPHYSLMLHGLVDRRVLRGVLGAYAGLGPILNERGVAAHLALAGPFVVSDRWLFRKERHTQPALVRGPHVANRKARSDPRLILTRTSWQIARAIARSPVAPLRRKLAMPVIVGQYFARSAAHVAVVRLIAWLNQWLPRGIYGSLRQLYRGIFSRRTPVK